MKEDWWMRRTWLSRALAPSLTLLMAWVVTRSVAVELVTENPRASCREYTLPRELRIYKDPALFPSNLGLIDLDPSNYWDQIAEESPLLTTVSGVFRLMIVGPAREIRSFAVLTKLYELKEDRRLAALARKGKGGARTRLESDDLLFLPVKVCEGAYLDTLGVVKVSDLRQAQIDVRDEGQMPPSTYPNPIPKLRQDLAR